jgi:hypothetical protein
MFPVEIRMDQQTEDAFTARMSVMREWLDHHRYEPSTFRYTFIATGMLFRVEFKIEAEARAFAQEFDGCVAPRSKEISAE